MSGNDPFARTMRIDLDAREDAGAAPVRPLRRRAGSARFAARRHLRGSRDTPYDKLLESVYDGVFITDRGGTILDFNARAAEMFHLDEARLIGVSVVDLVSGADDSLIATILANLERSRYTLVEARCTRADGSAFPAEIAVNRLNLEAEGQLGFFVRDVTLRRQALDALEAAVERLQAHDRARMEFVSNVSHELRTPLTSMIYAVGNMLRGVVGPLPEKAVRYLERLESDCRRLLGTVNDILDLSQVENHALTLSRTRTPLGRLASAALDGLRVQAEVKRQRLLFEPPTRECFASCDQQKMERVITNVVGNAIKFTPEEGAVTVRVGPDQTNPGRVVVEVADTGVGIPREALDKVTQRYFRVGDHPNGAGLGLAISKEIVELHGGTLLVESPVPGTDRGTAVRVCLPAVPPPAVVIATADEVAGASLQRLIEEHGYAVVRSATGRETLACCAAAPADLLLLDQRLPDADVAALLLQVREDKRTQRLPAIVLVRDTLARPTLDMFQRLGVSVLSVPWRDSDLTNRVAQSLSGRAPASASVNV